MSGVGGAIALADPGQGRSDDRKNADGRSGSDDRAGDGSIGDIVRRALGMHDGGGEKASEPRKRPDTRWGNGRGPWHGPGQQEPPSSGTPKPPTENPRPDEPKDPCDDDPGPGNPPGNPGPDFPESGGGGGGATEQLPRYKPPSVPDMQLPGEVQPAQPGVPGGTAALEAGAGVVAAAAPVGAAVPIALPVIVAPPLGIGGGGGGAGPRTGPAPDVKSIFAQPPAGRSSPPANVGSNAAVPNASYRIGYTEYLRTAGLPQVAALAVPGLVGIMVLTGAGGLVGYRQAKAGHAVRVGGSARFMR